MRGLVGNVVAIELLPQDIETENNLSVYRNQVSKATGVRFPDHDTYIFHISLAYQLIQLDAEEQQELSRALAKIDSHLNDTFGVLDTNSPLLVFFDDMFKFVPISERQMLASRMY